MGNTKVLDMKWEWVSATEIVVEMTVDGITFNGLLTKEDK